MRSYAMTQRSPRKGCISSESNSKKSVLPKFNFPKNNCLGDPRLKPKLIWDHYSKRKRHVKDIYKQNCG